MRNLTQEQRDNISTWVEALRSGKYKQGRQALQTRARQFCCLGVICDVQGVPNDAEESNIFNVGYKFPTPSQDGTYERSGYPDERWLHDVVGMDRFSMTRLAEKNDSGATFKQIAALIERWAAGEEL